MEPLPEDAAVPPDEVSTRAPASLAALHAEMAAGLRIDPRRNQELGKLVSAAEWLRDNSRCLRDDLTALVDDPQRLDDVADRSSIHPNGFAKIVLYPDERFGVRLHIWSRREGLWAEETQPHGHRWAFASWIVVGRVHEVSYSTEPRPGSGGQYIRYGYVREELRPRLNAIDDAVLWKDGVVDHDIGDVYWRARHELHTAAPDGHGLVASLVLQGSHDNTPTAVYVRPERKPREGEQELRPDRIKFLVEAVLDASWNVAMSVATERNHRLMA
jgi:hypothetical protein